MQSTEQKLKPCPFCGTAEPQPEQPMIENQKLREACNYIDALGGDSRSYRQARAALSAGVEVDAQRYRWLMENVVGFECCPPTLLIRLPEDVVFDFSNPSAAIDAAMRKGQL